MILISGGLSTDNHTPLVYTQTPAKLRLKSEFHEDKAYLEIYFSNEDSIIRV
tara:strand:- start:1697 stop:1852 length:156 start_codon:yes stop_codon:yes gene_type:complete